MTARNRTASRPVARMKRSGIRGRLIAAAPSRIPVHSRLHPGYEVSP